MGEFGFTERDLNVAMTPHLGSGRLHRPGALNPMHTYAKPPAYELYVSTGPTRRRSRAARREARSGLRARPAWAARSSASASRSPCRATQIEAAPRARADSDRRERGRALAQPHRSVSRFGRRYVGNRQSVPDFRPSHSDLDIGLSTADFATVVVMRLRSRSSRCSSRCSSTRRRWRRRRRAQAPQDRRSRSTPRSRPARCRTG